MINALRGEKRNATRDRRAFEELIGAHLDSLYRTALRMCAGNVADAEDLLQDAVLRALEKFGSLTNLNAARSWLFTILVRTNLNRVRSSRRRRELSAEDFTGEEFDAALAQWRASDTPEQLFDHAELQSRLTHSLDCLDPSLREVVWLADVEEFSLREVSSMLDIPEGTAASRLFRARRELRRSLGTSATKPALRAI